MDKDLIKIRLLFDCPDNVSESFQLYIQSLEASLSNMIPDSVLNEAPNPDNPQAVRDFFNRIDDQMPLISTSLGKTAPYIISLRFLAQAKFTHGMGRFLSDTVSRWLVPGKQLPLVSVNSMAFEFVRYPGMGFFFHEIFAQVNSEKDFQSAAKNIDGLVNQVKLNILSVRHARSIVAQKSLTLTQKKMIIQENIATLLGKPNSDSNETIFDQVHQFLIKILAEKKVSEIKEQINPLLDLRPQIFERDVFNELHEYLSLIDDKFSAFRNSRHITRIIAYIYLFRKTVINSTILDPDQRHLSLKILKTNLQSDVSQRPLLGMVICINFISENEIFEERHVVKAMQSIVPNSKKVEGSYFETRKTDSVISVYIEMEKEDHAPFTSKEIALIKQKLPTQIKTRVETVINPIFMQKNEEEIMRNILILSNQLRYVQDFPQVIISFLKQTDQSLAFVVVLARILRPGDKPLKQILPAASKDFKIENLEVKTTGLLRKKYPKEANVFEVQIKKKRFLREDFSLDLYEARRVVYDSLTNVLGEIRDYNGGMISKQNEALKELTKLLLQEDIQNDFLIENYFYSLMPVYTQSVLPPRILQKQFMMLLHATEHDYIQQPYFMQVQIVDNYFVLMLGSMNPSFKTVIQESVESSGIDMSDLTTSSLNTYDILCLGYLFQFANPKEYENLLISVTDGIKKWQASLEVPQTFDPVTLHLSDSKVGSK